MPGANTARSAGAAARPRGLYDTDAFTWSRRQAAALRRRDFGAVDWENVIEEIEDVGNRHADSWESLCGRVMEHMLAIEHWEPASARRLGKWCQEIRTWRNRMARLIRKNPGLQGKYAELFEDAWGAARDDGAGRLARYAGGSPAEVDAAERRWERILPVECPYSLHEVTAFDLGRDKKPRRDVWPPDVARALNERGGTEHPVRSWSGMDYRIERQLWRGR